MKNEELEQKLQAYFEAEANDFAMSPEAELKVFCKRSARKRFPLRRFLAVAACILFIAGALAVPFLQKNFILLGEQSQPIDDLTEQSDSGSVNISAAPWKNGSLQLTSVTYKGNATSQTNTFGGALLFASKTKRTSENISISLLANTKISGCVNANLLSITPVDGEHVGCEGVFYDIRADRMFCLACHIKKSIADNPYYIDICIRSLIEEYLITNENVLAGIIDYKQMYLSLYNEKAIASFSSGKAPSCEALEFDYGSRNTDFYDALMQAFRYPIIRVIEYGENVDRCLFTIGSPVSQASWGAYVYELDTDKVLKLDGETVGLPFAINGYMGLTPDELPAINLSLATGVSVSEDYGKIIVTLPYFMEHYDIDETGHLIPVYTGQNVIVFDTARGTHEGLLGNSPNQDVKQLDLPTAHAKSYKDLIYYPAQDGAWCLYANGFCYKLQGELLRLIERDGGGYTAVMKKGASYEAFVLEGGEAVNAQEEEIYVLEGNKRVLITDGSAHVLWEKEPGAKVVSASGRFVYLYFEGDAFITCIDIDSGEQGQLDLSEDFISEVSAQSRAEYLLFLNPSENRMLIAYYQKGALVFDSAAFLEQETLLQDADQLRISFVFEHNFEKALPYFYNEESKVKFLKRDAVLCAAKALGMEGLYELAAQDRLNDMSDLIVSVANQIAALADYSGSSAEISGRTLNELLDGMTFDAFDELYEELFGHFEEIRYTDNILSSTIGDDGMEVLANDIASGILTYVYGYVAFVEEDYAYFKEHMPTEYAVYEELHKRLNEGIDQDKMNYLHALLAERLSVILADAGIDEKHPVYTGYQLNTILESHLFELISIALDGSKYTEFISSCGFAHPYDDAYYSGKTDRRLDCLLISDKYAIDSDALKHWLSDIEFVDGTADIDREAGIYMEWEMNLFYVSYYMYPGTEVITVGHDSKGDAYAVISDSYAAISEEQFEAFYSICGKGTPFDRDSGIGDLIDQIRAELN